MLVSAFVALVCSGCGGCLGGSGALADLSDEEKRAVIAEMYNKYRKSFAGTPEMSVEELLERRVSEDLVLVDVREPEEMAVSLELGGKSALILLDDMPGIPDIAAAAGASVCMHSGQGCAMLTRVLVPRAQLAEAAEKLKAAMATVKLLRI